MSAAVLAPPAPAPAPANDAEASRRVIPAPFITEVLSPYRGNARYLRTAELMHVRAAGAGPDPRLGVLTGRGRFSIPESCYIDDTGHFNAVEFNICFNQLAYVVFGHCIAAGLMERVIPSWADKVTMSYADFRRHQLPSMLIARIEGRFSKQLASQDFLGELTVNRVTGAGRSFFCFTSIAFSNGGEVKSKGNVVLAFSPAAGGEGV